VHAHHARTHHCRGALEGIEPALQNLRIGPGFALCQPPDGLQNSFGAARLVRIAKGAEGWIALANGVVGEGRATEGLKAAGGIYRRS